MSSTPDLTNARMSYAAAVLGCITYGIYFVLAIICIHFLLRRRLESRSQKVIFGYTVIMLVVTTIYTIAAIVWSEVEFVESTVDISVFDTLLDSPLAILKDTAYTFNIWLADSLIVYRLFVVWGGYVPVVLLPCLLWVGTVSTGIGLLVNTAKPLANLNQETIINYQTAFYSLTVSHNVICTLFIAGRLWHQQRILRVMDTAGGKLTYNSIIAVVVESAALYSLCGIIYIPLVVRMLPLQFPITALIGSLTAIAPNLIILRIALGTAVTREATTAPAITFKLSTLRSTVPSTVETTAVSNASRSTIPLGSASHIWPSDGKESERGLQGADGDSFVKETV